MSIYRIIAVDQSEAPPLDISPRLRSQLVYFITPTNAPQVPSLQDNEYWIDAPDAQQWLDAGVFELISPLDEQNKTEIELSEEQETLIEWLVTHRVQHIRVEEVD